MNRDDKNLTVYNRVTDIPRSLNEQTIKKINKVIPKSKDKELNHAGTMIKVQALLIAFYRAAVSGVDPVKGEEIQAPTSGIWIYL